MRWMFDDFTGVWESEPISGAWSHIEGRVHPSGPKEFQAPPANLREIPEDAVVIERGEWEKLRENRAFGGDVDTLRDEGRRGMVAILLHLDALLAAHPAPVVEKAEKETGVERIAAEITLRAFDLSGIRDDKDFPDALDVNKRLNCVITAIAEQLAAIKKGE